MAIVKQQPLATLYSQAAKITGGAIAAQRNLEAAKEQHREARKMEAQERAHQWEVEKMDMRSRADFAEMEMARQEKRANLQAALKRIDEIETIPESTKEGLRAKAILNYHRVDVSDRVLFPELYERQGQKQSALDFLRTRMGEAGAPTPEQLKIEGTREAYNKGVELGYWDGEVSAVRNPVTGVSL